MENASKALLLAGGVLISLIIISMLVLVSNSLTSYQEIKNKGNEVDVLAEFNAQYEAYNRDDVRGNELYTLANKVLDYNRRQTASIAPNTNDIGDTVGYKPIILKIDFVSLANRKKLTIDDKNRLFNGNVYHASEGTTNDLEDALSKINGSDGIEARWGAEVANQLASHITEIFIEGGSSLNANTNKEKMVEAIYKFDRIYGKKILQYEGSNSSINTSWSKLWGNSELKEDDGRTVSSNVKEEIYTYYEFINFKRARFKCTSIEKDEAQTGRITSLSFKFTGEIN